MSLQSPGLGDRSPAHPAAGEAGIAKTLEKMVKRGSAGGRPLRETRLGRLQLRRAGAAFGFKVDLLVDAIQALPVRGLQFLGG